MLYAQEVLTILTLDRKHITNINDDNERKIVNSSFQMKYRGGIVNLFK